MKRPRLCLNCGHTFTWAYAAQTVCCVWNGPRWADDKQAYADYVEYREWYTQLPNIGTGGK